MRHPCPAKHCPRDVPGHLLMCGICWRLVPPAIRRAVDAAYNHGDGLDSLALQQAQADAINAVNAARAARGYQRRNGGPR